MEVNKTVELVKLWGEFEKSHPLGSIEDFCKDFVSRQYKERIKDLSTNGHTTAITSALLMRIISRISRLNQIYASKALKETGLRHLDEFSLIQTIGLSGSATKSEIIYSNLQELSSGTDLINRMIKRGLIREYPNPDDKRSKLVSLTAKGKEVNRKSAEKMIKLFELFTSDLSEEDINLCIQLLKPTEMQFSDLWQNNKGKTLEEVTRDNG
ncbi:MAG: winged helix DNA-binding protein [Saprospiraceae bacterium]|nr:winged helix DNA-binding protein [Saprospiraceae bacterium]